MQTIPQNTPQSKPPAAPEIQLPQVPSFGEKRELITRIRANFPSELQALPQWVVWRFEARSSKGGRPKHTKVPYAAAGRGGKAKPNDPATWAPFDVAAEALQENPYMYGLGFVFAPGGDLVGVDFDKCITGGRIDTLSEWHRGTLDTLNSYTELSPSGTGLHTFVGGELPTNGTGTRNDSKGTELYHGGRFFTVTGLRVDAWQGEIHPRQAELAALYAEIAGGQAKPQAAEKRPSSAARRPAPMGDDKLLRKMLRSGDGAAIERLWNGDTSGHDGDHNRADLALCDKLAWWTNGDTAQMDHMFRQSGLMRPKWDEKHFANGQTYGQWTIGKALSNADGYSGTKPQESPAPSTVAIPAGAAEPLEDQAPAAALEDGFIAEHPDPVAIGLGLIPSAQREGLPEIDVTLPLDLLMDAAKNAILQANSREESPIFYLRGGVPVTVNEDRIEVVTENRLKALLARVARWVKYGKDKEGNEVTTEVRPPGDLPGPLLAENEWPGVQRLEGITHAPSFAPNGTLHSRKGYNPATKLYNVGTLAIGDTTPTAAGVQAAKDLLLGEYLGDFPFVDDASKAHALALLLLPFLRQMISGATPLHLVTAPTAGSGKGKLVRAALAPALGVVKPVTEPGDDGEWRKEITTWVMEGRSAIYVDNLHHELKGGPLATALTEPSWSNRLLGSNTSISGPILWAWAATGNNPTMTGEIGRRVVLIQLNPRVEDPSQRSNFQHPDLERWGLANRGRLAAAACILIRNWVDRGRPLWRERVKGSYEGWVQVIGGVLAAAGVPGFLANEDQVKQQATPDEQAYKLFVAAWAETHVTAHVSTGELFALAGETDPDKDGGKTGQNILGALLGSGNERARRTIFGQRIMRRLNGRIFAGWEVLRAGTDRTGIALWKLQRLPEAPELPAQNDQNTAEKAQNAVPDAQKRGTCAVPQNGGTALFEGLSPEVEGPAAVPAVPGSNPAHAREILQGDTCTHTHVHATRTHTRTGLGLGTAGTANTVTTSGENGQKSAVPQFGGTAVGTAEHPPGGDLRGYFGRVLTVHELAAGVGLANAAGIGVRQTPTAGGWLLTPVDTQTMPGWPEG